MKEILDFLRELRVNNNRDWFNVHKEEYDRAKKEFETFTQSLILKIGEFDKEILNVTPKECVFRLFRDIRFTHDKTPYKNHFSVSFDRTKPLLRGGMYLHIENDTSFVGGGFWEPNNEDLFRIRKEIELDASDLKEIITDKTFVSYFGTLEGEELKTAPKGFDKTHPDIELIRKKQFVIRRKFSNKEVLSPNFQEEVLATFKAMRPFFDYMSDVLSTDLNGESIY